MVIDSRESREMGVLGVDVGWGNSRSVRRACPSAAAGWTGVLPTNPPFRHGRNRVQGKLEGETMSTFSEFFSSFLDLSVIIRYYF